jgi:hypothetical protein
MAPCAFLIAAKWIGEPKAILALNPLGLAVGFASGTTSTPAKRSAQTMFRAGRRKSLARPDS